MQWEQEAMVRRDVAPQRRQQGGPAGFEPPLLLLPPQPTAVSPAMPAPAAPARRIARREAGIFKYRVQ